MRWIRYTGLLTAAVLFGSSEPALAMIDEIKGTLLCRNGCNRTTAQKVAQGDTFTFRVFGQWVDTAIEVIAPDITSEIVNRKHGPGSYIDIKFTVGPYITPGERIVKIHYPIETNGYDSFKIQVVKRGTISSIAWKKPTEGKALKSGSGKGQVNLPDGHELVPPVNLPLNERISLVVTGEKLLNIGMHPLPYTVLGRMLPGATNQRLEIEVMFHRSGEALLKVFDPTVSAQERNAQDNYLFAYTGTTSARRIQWGGQSAPTPVGQPPTAGGNTAVTSFVDLAPRAIIEHLFRRQNPEPAFVNQNGVRFFTIDPQYCSGISGESQATITIPHPIWGVTNVGSLPVTTAFASQLKSGATVLATQMVPSLTPGQEAHFTFTRPTGSSEGTPVRVTRLNNVSRVGCFLSPELPPYFEDPPLTVTVNSNGAAPEAPDYQVNNSRIF